MKQAAWAVKHEHGLLLEAAFEQLRQLDDRQSRFNVQGVERAANHALLGRYYDLVHETLRQAPSTSPILQQVSNWMGLTYFNDARWREVLLRLLKAPDCTPAMIESACRLGADINAVVRDATLVDTVLVQSWPHAHAAIDCLVAAGATFEDSAQRRENTFACLATAESDTLFAQNMIALVRGGFRLECILYEEGNRDVCQSIVGRLTRDTIDQLAGAGLRLDGIGRHGKTLGHYAAGCGAWMDTTLLLPTLRAANVDFNAMSEEGSRPIAYLMRQHRPIDETVLQSWWASGIDFELTTKTRLLRAPGRQQGLIQLDCLNALSLAAIYDHAELARWLIGKRLCVTAHSLSTAAQLARNFGHLNLANYLLSCLPRS
jgi:hypothetical protein